MINGRVVVLLILLIVVFAMFGCSNDVQSPKDKQKYGDVGPIRESCIKGVMYYTSGHKMAPALKPNGTPYLCN